MDGQGGLPVNKGPGGVVDGHGGVGVSLSKGPGQGAGAVEGSEVLSSGADGVAGVVSVPHVAPSPPGVAQGPAPVGHSGS